MWYGPTSTNPVAQATDCCELWDQLGEPTNFSVIFARQETITDGRWKLIYDEQPDCLAAAGAVEYEFYDLSQCFAANLLFGRGIDNPSFNLVGTTMTPQQTEAFDRLKLKLTELQTNLEQCVGDITMMLMNWGWCND